MIQSPARWGIGMVMCASLAACSSSTPAGVVTVTTTRTPTAAASIPPTAESTPATSAEATHSTSTGVTALPGTCETLLADNSVFAAAGVKNLSGHDAFVVGTPDPVIHRLAYLNCRYGVTGNGAGGRPAIEIGVSLYATSVDAAQRITATVDDYSAHGASTSTIRVLDRQATLLTGASGTGYDVPTLVVADGQRTVAVSIDESVVPAAKVAGPAAAVAKLALQRTAG